MCSHLLASPCLPPFCARWPHHQAILTAALACLLESVEVCFLNYVKIHVIHLWFKYGYNVMYRVVAHHGSLRVHAASRGSIWINAPSPSVAGHGLSWLMWGPSTARALETYPKSYMGGQQPVQHSCHSPQGGCH